MSFVLQKIVDMGWAITPAALEAIMEIAARESEWFKSGKIDPETFKLFHQNALQVVDGQYLEGTHNTYVIGGVAVIPLYGPIYPRANLMTNYSGATSSETLVKDFKIALESRHVNSILFDGDSPGGAVTNTSEASDFIFHSRGKKPIKSFASGMAASAALWILSSTDEFIASSTAEIGSVGVVAAFRDTSKRDEKEGVKTIEIVSSISPLKRVGVDTDEGRGKIQRIVDATAEIFVASLARNRGVSVETVKEKFGKGDLFLAKEAKERGMIDRISTFNNVLDEMVIKHNTTIYKGATMTVKANETETSAAVPTFDEGKMAGIKAEQERIKAIKAIPHKGMEAFVEAHLYDDGMTADKMALAILNEQERIRSAQLKTIETEGAALAGKVQNIGAGQSSDEDIDANEKAAVIAAMVNGLNSNRK